jgi:hypothetical protein
MDMSGRGDIDMPASGNVVIVVAMSWLTSCGLHAPQSMLPPQPSSTMPHQPTKQWRG